MPSMRMVKRRADESYESLVSTIPEYFGLWPGTQGSCETSPQAVPAGHSNSNTSPGVGRCLLEVLLLSSDAGLESRLPALESFAHSVRRATLDDKWELGDADVALIDARFDLAAARRTCRRLTASAPALAVVAVVGPADLVEVDVDWHFDDVLLASAGAPELQARLKLAIKRRRGAPEATLEFGELVVQPARYTAWLAGKDLCLTLTEFKLLNFLVQHAGRAFTRTRLMREVCGYDCKGRVRTVDVHVRRLRAKLGAEHESIIETVRGVGYMAVTPPQPSWVVREPTINRAWTAATAESSIAQ